MSNKQIYQIEQICREIGEVQALIKLVPKVHRILAQCDAVDMLLQESILQIESSCTRAARDELQVLRSEISALIQGGAQ